MINENAIFFKTESFCELQLDDLYKLNAGGFWDGLALVGTSIVVAASAIAVVATAPVTIPVGLICVGAVVAAQFGTGVGIAVMVGFDL